MVIRYNIIHNLYEDKTLYIIGGSQEFLFLDLYHTDRYDTQEIPVDLSKVREIVWTMAPFSVLKEKKIAYVIKKYTRDEIIILNDPPFNRIQITIKDVDTMNISGAFLYQVTIVDSVGTNFVPLEGIIVINQKIHEA